MNLSLSDEQVQYMIECICKIVEKLQSGDRKPEMNYS